MKKDLVILLIIIFLGGLLIGGTNIQSVDDYYLTHIDDITQDSDIVTVRINCNTILDNWNDLDASLKYEKYVPKDGIILDFTDYVLRANDTAFDILLRVTRYNKIQMAYQGADYNIYNSIYVQGINHLFEFSCGFHSGWTYRVNGKFPNVGSSKYLLQDGDILEWLYTCDLGRDLDMLDFDNNLN